MQNKQAEVNIKNVVGDMKSSLIKSMQKMFDELRSKTDKVDKLSKSMDSAVKSLEVVKTDSKAALSRMEDIATSITNLVDTNKETIHLVAGTGCKDQSTAPTDPDILNIKKLVDELRLKSEKQQSEINNLNEQIRNFQQKIPSNSSYNRIDKAPILVNQQSTTPTNNNRKQGTICSGPSRTSIRVANPNIGERLAKLSWIYISNIDVNTTPENIIEALDPTHKNLYKCEKLPSKYRNPQSASFKLGVPETLEGHYMSSDFWPDGAYIAKYYPPQFTSNINRHGRPNFRRTQPNRSRRT